MSDPQFKAVPDLFQWLMDNGYISSDDYRVTEDDFFCICKSLSSILERSGILFLPDSEGTALECRYFFDDWFVYAVTHNGHTVYSLFKMREQEDDKDRGILADADTPGVTISFIAFDADAMKNCLADPSLMHQKLLAVEVNRVAAYRRQTHDGVLKAYFVRAEAEAPYLIADLYVNQVASLSSCNVLKVPDAYRTIFKKRECSAKFRRIPKFLEENNRHAGRTVCDHHSIIFQDRNLLSKFEKLAVLATHTGNVSFHSFAAEVRFHALFLTKLATIRIPLLGSPYESAIRADMSIHDREFQGPAPYYNLSGKMVKQQEKYHPQI